MYIYNINKQFISFCKQPNLIQLHLVFFIMTFAAVATACLLVLFLTSIVSFQVRVKDPLLPRVRVTARLQL